MELKELAGWASAIMSILALIAFFIRPVMASFTQITKNLTEITHSLDLINRDLESSKSDRTAIHSELMRHDEETDQK